MIRILFNNVNTESMVKLNKDKIKHFVNYEVTFIHINQQFSVKCQKFFIFVLINMVFINY